MTPEELFKEAGVTFDQTQRVQYLEGDPMIKTVTSQFQNAETRASFLKLLSETRPENRSLLELLMRIGHDVDKNNPLLPQVGIFLPGVKDGAFAPRHPFSFPCFYYHVTPADSSLTAQTHSQELLPFSENLNNQFKYRISNQLVELLDNDGDPLSKDVVRGFGKNPHYCRNQNVNEPFSLQFEHSVVRFASSEISLKNEQICCTDAGQQSEVKIVLDSVPQNDLKFAKVNFHLKDDRIEVMALMDNFTMAGGVLTINQEGPHDNPAEYVCTLNEIPGTYGTTDFVISPDFRSMVRVSMMKPKTRENVREKVRANEKTLQRIVPVVQEILDRNSHHEDNDVCFACNDVVRIGRLLLNGVAVPELMKELGAELWTAREKMVYLSWRFESKYETDDGEKCVFAQEMVDHAKMIVDKKFEIPEDENDELLAEYSYFLIFSLTGLQTCFRPRWPYRKASVLRSMNYFVYYKMSMRELIAECKSTEGEINRVILDLMCQKATPKDYKDILYLYPRTPFLADIIRKYPGLVLFGVHLVKPSVHLIQVAALVVEEYVRSLNEPAWRRRYKVRTVSILRIAQRILAMSDIHGLQFLLYEAKPGVEHFNKSDKTINAETFHLMIVGMLTLITEGCEDDKGRPWDGMVDPNMKLITFYKHLKYNFIQVLGDEVEETRKLIDARIERLIDNNDEREVSKEIIFGKLKTFIRSVLSFDIKDAFED